MKTETTPAERRKFYQLHQDGLTYEQIAERYAVSPMCVRYWCRKQGKGEGVENHYYNPRSGILSQFDESIRVKILELRQAHPRWGPASIGLQLSKDTALQSFGIPSRSSIGRYLHSFPEYHHYRKKRGK